MPDDISLTIESPAIAHEPRTSVRPSAAIEAPVVTPVIPSAITIPLPLWCRTGSKCCIFVRDFRCFSFGRDYKTQCQQRECDSQYPLHLSFPFAKKLWSGTLAFLERARPILKTPECGVWLHYFSFDPVLSIRSSSSFSAASLTKS